MSELSVLLDVDGQSRVPIFDQLRVGVIDAIRAGRLNPGTRLPTVRDLAGQLGLAANTVARAYRELESAGVIAAVDPAGAAMTAAARGYAETARSLGLGRAEALRYLEAAFD